MEEAALGLATPTLVGALRARVSVDFAGDRTGHDLAHLDRVHGLASRLRSVEGGDPVVLAAACYVHDYHRVLERRSEDFEVSPHREAIDGLIGDALEAVDFPAELISQVCGCVEFTDKYSFSGHALDSTCIEARILRDADNLDALGAIGIARAFMFGGALGEPIWVENAEVAEVYEPGTTTSIVHHFHEKLLRVRDDMLTDAGRRMADERHDFMMAFLSQLRREWDCAHSDEDVAPRVK